MTQLNVKASNIKFAKHKFLRKYPHKKIWDVTRIFVKDTPKSKRVYRVTGINKKK